MEYTDYNANATYGDLEFISENKQYQTLPKRIKYHTSYIEKKVRIKLNLRLEKNV